MIDKLSIIKTSEIYESLLANQEKDGLFGLDKNKLIKNTLRNLHRINIKSNKEEIKEILQVLLESGNLFCPSKDCYDRVLRPDLEDRYFLYTDYLIKNKYKINSLEIITEEGTEFTKKDHKICSLLLSKDNKTLKIFLRKIKEKKNEQQ